MLFCTTLKDYSFEVSLRCATSGIPCHTHPIPHQPIQLVLFSDSVHLSASSDAERAEWMHLLQTLIPRSSYDERDPLQAAALEKEVEACDTTFYCESSPGILLERRGNWAIAALVSESLSRTVRQGSVLSKIEGNPVMMIGFDSVITSLSYWQPPLKLSFQLSPRKMGWLTLLVKEGRRNWLNIRSKSKTNEMVWGEFDS